MIGITTVLGALALAGATSQGPAPAVSAPPEAFFGIVTERDREPARAFYRKYLDVGGLPVVASGEVADLALHRTHEIVSRMLAGRPDVLQAMVRNRMYLIIIGKDQKYTDMPEYRNSPNPEYMNERVRGTGGRPTSFGEENLLSLPIDRYDDESIGVHEFCHTIDGALASVDPTWRHRKNEVYRNSIAKGLWKNTYAAGNSGEFFAEVCQAYFYNNRVNNWNHGPIGTREQLKAYDPEAYELVHKVFNLKPEQDWRYKYLQKLPNVIPPPEKFKIDPFYTKFTWAREFTVVGRGASDEAMLKVNDTIRKMFAYRHDILKALIGEGVKLVVLGKSERAADLPEFKGREDVDLLARTVEYGPSKTLVVGEEMLAEVVPLFARALYRATAFRPVDPNWNSRGRDVQQYELRVKRLDVEFDVRLKGLYDAAIGAGKWKNSAAVNSREDYWVNGVLAYFDVPSADQAPEGADHPIQSREELKAYDPDLYALVHETMAYGGKVDWRWEK